MPLNGCWSVIISQSQRCFLTSSPLYKPGTPNFACHCLCLSSSRREPRGRPASLSVIVHTKSNPRSERIATADPQLRQSEVFGLAYVFISNHITITVLTLRKSCSLHTRTTLSGPWSSPLRSTHNRPCPRRQRQLQRLPTLNFTLIISHTSRHFQTYKPSSMVRLG